ncbi:biosurfactant protein 1 [Haloferax volcanii]|uniref:Uncharacterized protein n=3 Tax=Haloferax volcanii TaxID=2246 RepID=A0A384LKQ6_HALVD|nr:hypothetical protein [Haloferax volcanii]ADE02212.1 uncharacterized protein HVO_A0398 [Haloferax volcanii DS2]ELY30792.1 hypothetical protein C498_10551 [Haloferax volcanii DS2]MBS8121013.1 hypothetical protein [Haloferax volcanii]MBS8126050.1 hypothetical protein [Haloferax volcanii]MBS8129903.1 hypothetical protein [Haloferax volcanii]
MYNRYSDFEELRPTGEASHIPDSRLDDGCEGSPRRQRVATSTGDYPDQPSGIGAECQSCGASIPNGQTKCRFCLTNHLGAPTDNQQPADTEWTLLHVVQLLVEASTVYHALAKGAAAATLLAKPDRDPAVDDCQLLYDFDDAPASQLTDEWPSLPDAVRATSERGDRLLVLACARTPWTEPTETPRGETHRTFLYDEEGHSIRDVDRLTGLLEYPENDVWLVPAIALQRSVDDVQSGNRCPSVPSKTRLDCRSCDRTTVHQFQEFESVPAENWTGQPMWECQVCQSPRHGPAPE